MEPYTLLLQIAFTFAVQKLARFRGFGVKERRISLCKFLSVKHLSGTAKMESKFRKRKIKLLSRVQVLRKT